VLAERTGLSFDECVETFVEGKLSSLS
jgi:hypothetical protein